MENRRPYQLVAGSLPLDLVNTLDNRFVPARQEELLSSYGDLLRFLTQSGSLTSAQSRVLANMAHRQKEGARILGHVKELREALGEVAYALVDQKKVAREPLDELELIFKQHRDASTLSSDGVHFKWQLSQPVVLATPLWILAREAESLLLSERINQVRACGVETCRWLFLDTSRSHSRRWCDMKICGNRVKARKFQARMASS